MGTLNLDTFTPEARALITELDLARLPHHVAIIMDGNGRWATQQGLPRVIGHRAGVESVRNIMEAGADLGLGYLTLYSFSTENWSRPEDEVTALMGLIEHHLREETTHMHARGVRVRHLGRTAGLPESLLAALHDAWELTKHNTGMTLQFAINYSGRAELLDAARRLATAAAAGELDPAALTEQDVSAALYHPDVPDPDLLIRTAGELRVSNYLLWQIAYSEIWVTPDLWPDFRALQFLQALCDYQHRQRKFGRVPS
ncbi:MAG TPA: isoprenyl transferase [Armatimonadota bacterium]|jgi:undecaprenyl diphosphate synthase